MPAAMNRKGSDQRRWTSRHRHIPPSQAMSPLSTPQFADAFIWTVVSWLNQIASCPPLGALFGMHFHITPCPLDRKAERGNRRVHSHGMESYMSSMQHAACDTRPHPEQAVVTRAGKDEIDDIL